MLRKILGLVAGLLTFFFVVTVIQLLSGLMFGMPSLDTIGNPERMKAFVAAMPVGGFVGLLVSYIVGSFTSGLIMRKISQSDSNLLPVIVGLIGTLGWVYNIIQIPHPMWVTILGFLCYLPFTILGHRVASGRQ